MEQDGNFTVKQFHNFVQGVKLYFGDNKDLVHFINDMILNEKCWKKIFQDSEYAEEIIFNRDINSSKESNKQQEEKKLIGYFREYFEDLITSKVTNLEKHLIKHYTRKNSKNEEKYIFKNEVDAFVSNLIGRLGIHQPNFTSKYSEPYQKAFLLNNLEYDQIYRPSEKFLSELKKNGANLIVLLNGISKHTTKAGFDDIIIWKQSDKECIDVRIIQMKSGSHLNLKGSWNPLYNHYSKSSSLVRYRTSKKSNFLDAKMRNCFRRLLNSEISPIRKEITKKIMV